MNIFKSNKSGSHIIGISGDFKDQTISLESYIYRELVSKSEFQILPYIEPDLTIEQVRIKRNQLLSEYDYMFSSDYPQPSNINEIKAYRQTLRDITENLNLVGIKSIEDVVFPKKPI